VKGSRRKRCASRWPASLFTIMLRRLNTVVTTLAMRVGIVSS
jgi:hypothetical protein